MAQVSAYSIYRVVLVVVGVLVAAALVIGVILLLHNRGEQVRHDQATQLADQEVKNQQKNATSTNSSSNTSKSTSTQTNTPPVAVTGTAALPTTGMSDSIVPFVVVGLLTFATASYLVSRRRLNQQ